MELIKTIEEASSRLRGLKAHSALSSMCGLTIEFGEIYLEIKRGYKFGDSSIFLDCPWFFKGNSGMFFNYEMSESDLGELESTIEGSLVLEAVSSNLDNSLTLNLTAGTLVMEPSLKDSWTLFYGGNGNYHAREYVSFYSDRIEGEMEDIERVKSQREG
jgi:hypothetical protein